MNGLVHIYSGTGKGKTTAAVGLCTRSAGWGKKVAFYEFLKGSETGEAKALAMLGVKVYCPVKTEKFTFAMTDTEKEECAARQLETLMHAGRNMADFDLIVLDEALSAVSAGMLNSGALIDFVKNKAPETELIITGRGSFEELEILADYVTEITSKKHPYANGVQARKGIEY